MTGGRTCVRAAVCVAGSRGSSVAALVDGLRRSLSLAREFLFWRWGREHGDGMGCVCGGKREGGRGGGWTGVGCDVDGLLACCGIASRGAVQLGR